MLKVTVETVSFKGQDAIRITCPCATHKTGNAAVITGAAAPAIAALKGAKLTERVHGFVLLANHPAAAMRAHNERKGIFAA